MNRKEAILKNSKTYHGKECKFGHGVVRYVTSYSCIECTAIATLSRDSSVFKKYIKSDKGQEWQKEYRHAPAFRAAQNKHKKKDYQNNKEWYQNKNLKQYGITLEEYDDMRMSQNFKCEICGTHEDLQTKRMSVDHCHQTKAVRKLLCGKCNMALGLVNENISILENMVNYIKVHNG